MPAKRLTRKSLCQIMTPPMTATRTTLSAVLHPSQAEMAAPPLLLRTGTLQRPRPSRRNQGCRKKTTRSPRMKSNRTPAALPLARDASADLSNPYGKPRNKNGMSNRDPANPYGELLHDAKNRRQFIMTSTSARRSSGISPPFQDAVLPRPPHSENHPHARTLPLSS